MRKYIAMMVLGLFVAGMSFEVLAGAGCCSRPSRGTQTEEVKEDSKSDEG